MENEGQGTIRWLILAALLIGAGVWYSWTAHQTPDRSQPQAFVDGPPARPSMVRAGVEVTPPEAPVPDDAPAPSVDE